MFVYGYSILSARLVVAFVSGTQRTRLIIWVSKKLLLIYPTVLSLIAVFSQAHCVRAARL